MKTKKIGWLLGVSSLCLVGMPLVSYAAENVESTPGKIVLTENTEPGKPLDPENPSEELETPSEEHEVTENPGPLSLDVIPKNFDFGTQAVKVDNAYSYSGVNNDYQGKQYVQVSDNRDGDVYGWKVTVKQKTYLTEMVENGEPHVLTGANLTLPQPTMWNSVATDGVVDDKFTTSEVSVNLTEQDYFVTQGDHGKGVSMASWAASEVGLTIPASVVKAGTYQNEIEWTLTANITA